jgi:hypothetical protein
LKRHRLVHPRCASCEQGSGINMDRWHSSDAGARHAIAGSFPAWHKREAIATETPMSAFVFNRGKFDHQRTNFYLAESQHCYFALTNSSCVLIYIDIQVCYTKYKQLKEKVNGSWGEITREKKIVYLPAGRTNAGGSCGRI